ncbi:hypothetical protein EV356DRAFT_530675 [Viridothelium virens]|uniref:SAP domain-containing protein n=1 Tax=Viridothelium virens TaxID=1048519 RepID=A0A6A6HFY2_VIRVR|nr:hypothetical protein EV356DRAFT_530675 [Viridothelium virens]
MANEDHDGSKAFGMGNLFFGDPNQLELPKLPAVQRSFQKLSVRTRRQDSYDDENEEWHGGNVNDESDDDSAPVQTTFGVYSRAKRAPSPSGKTAPKRQRIEGGRAAAAKKVTADLDSEDEIIVQMKQHNYSDRDVAYQLISEGRINYDKKTIATRWARLRRALADREDQLLDDELTDWHEGEDEVLVKSYHRAERQIEQEIEKARDKLWRYTSDLLRHECPTSRYSPRACKERYEALLDGTARVPPELDENPEARAAERVARLETKKREKEELEREREEEIRRAKLEAERKEQRRQDQMAARKAKKEQEMKQKKQKNLESMQERENKKKEAEQAKADARLYTERTKQEQRIRKEEAAARKAQEAAKARQSREAATQLKAQKDLELRKMKEAQARAKLEALQKAREIKERQQQVREENSNHSRSEKQLRPQLGKDKFVSDFEVDAEDDEEDELEVSDTEPKLEEKEDDGLLAPPATAASDGDNIEASSSNSPSMSKLAKSTATSPSSASTPSGVDKISPRRNMTIEELRDLLRKRGIEATKRCSKKWMLAQLALLDSKMTIEDLKKTMKERGLKQAGSKAQLIHRLAIDDASKSSSIP